VGLVTKIKDLEEANRRTTERFEKLQKQYLGLQKEHSELKAAYESTDSTSKSRAVALDAAMAAVSMSGQAIGSGGSVFILRQHDKGS
jgi:hypothetical protein